MTALSFITTKIMGKLILKYHMLVYIKLIPNLKVLSVDYSLNFTVPKNPVALFLRYIRTSLFSTPPTEQQVIKVDGNIIRECDVGRDETIEAFGYDGGHNTVVIKAGKIAYKNKYLCYNTRLKHERCHGGKYNG